MTVLIVGRRSEPEIESLTAAVRDRGGECVVCGVREWPDGPPLTVRPDGMETTLGENVRFDDVTGVYVDCLKLFRPYAGQFREDIESEFVPTLNQIREYRGLFEGVLEMFADHGARVVPRVDRHRWQDRKASQLDRLAAAGVPVPETVFTNDPDEVRSFFDAHDRVVYKAVTRGGKPHELTEADLSEERLAALATAPAQFQAFVPGDDLRVYVLDDEVVAVAWYDTDEFSFKLDVEFEMRRAQLPESARQMVRDAVDVAGLQFAAVDLRRDGGTHTVLEVNEAPRFGRMAAETDQDVAGALAAYLTDD